MRNRGTRSYIYIYKFTKEIIKPGGDRRTGDVIDAPDSK